MGFIFSSRLLIAEIFWTMQIKVIHLKFRLLFVQIYIHQSEEANYRYLDVQQFWHRRISTVVSPSEVDNLNFIFKMLPF